MKFAHCNRSNLLDHRLLRKKNSRIRFRSFYFVQDFEPHFYAHGSEYEFAENTYKMGFRGITAGDWLRDIMRNEYGMQADSFHFSYDDKVYQPKEKPDNEKRVFSMRARLPRDVISSSVCWHSMSCAAECQRSRLFSRDGMSAAMRFRSNTEI